MLKSLGMTAGKRCSTLSFSFLFALFLYRYGFVKEILQKYKPYATRLLYLWENIYSWLPVASLIDDHIFVTHGGISNITDLATISQIQRQKVFYFL